MSTSPTNGKARKFDETLTVNELEDISDKAIDDRDFETASDVADILFTRPDGQALAHEIRGRLRWWKGDYREALDEFRASFKLKPTSFVGSLAVECLIRIEEPARAVQEAVISIGVLPKSARLQIAHSEALVAEGNIKAAVSAATMAVELESHKIEPQLNLVKCLVAADEIGKAFDQATRSKAEFPENKDADVTFALAAILTADHRDEGFSILASRSAEDQSSRIFHDVGVGLLRSGKLSAAADVFEQGAEAYPHSEDLWNHLIETLCESGEVDRAVDVADRAKKANPTDYGPDLQLGGIAIKKRDTSAAVQFFRSAYQLAPEISSNRFNLAMALMLAENYVDALPLISEFAANHQSDPRARDILGVCELETGNYDAALASFDEALRIDPVYYNAVYNKAVGLRRNNNHAEAVLSLQYLLSADDPQYRELGVIEIAESYNAAGDERAAREYFERAAGGTRFADHARLHLAIFDTIDGHHGRAIELYRTVLATNPGDVTALANMATCLFFQKSYAEALEACAQLIKIRHEPEFFVLEAAIALKSKEYARCIIASDRATALEAGLSDALTLKAHALFELGRFKEAHDTLTELRAAHPPDNETILDEAVVLLSLDDAEAAIRCTREALTSDSKSGRARRLLIRALISNGKLYDARDQCYGLIEDEPTSYEAWGMTALLAVEIAEKIEDRNLLNDAVAYADESLKWVLCDPVTAERNKIEGRLQNIKGFALGRLGDIPAAKKAYRAAYESAERANDSTFLIARNLRRLEKAGNSGIQISQMSRATIGLIGLGELGATLYEAGAKNLSGAALGASLIFGAGAMIAAVILPQIERLKVAGVELQRSDDSSLRDLRLETDPARRIVSEPFEVDALHNINILKLPVGFYPREHAASAA